MRNQEILSLNETLYDEFIIEELEERYETDPLFLSNIFNLANTENGVLSVTCSYKKTDCNDLVCACDSGYNSGCACNKIPACPELTCGCNHHG